MAQLRDLRRRKPGESFCVFERGGRELAVPVSAAREVLSGRVAMPVAGAPPHLVGMIELRGELFPLVRADAWLALPELPHSPNDQILVIQCEDLRVGLVVDRVRDVRRIETDAIKPYPDTGGAGHFFRGLWETDLRSVAVLDAEQLVVQAASLRRVVPEWEPVKIDEGAVRRTSRGEDFCVFTRGGHELALPVSVAREMLTGEAITPVPQSPPLLVGVLNLRGELLPLIQIDTWLGVPVRPYGTTDQIVVMERGDVLVGVVIDRVRDVHPIEAHEIKPYSGTSMAPFRGQLESGDGGVLLVLDADQLVENAIASIATDFRRSQSAPGMTGSIDVGSENIQ